MANLFENKDRRVIPNWREFEKTIFLGELDFYETTNPFPRVTLGIGEYVDDWNSNQSVIHASELISAAIVNHVRHEEQVEHAAQFILQNGKHTTVSQRSLASKILEKEYGINPPNATDLLGSHNPTDPSFISAIHQNIRQLRSVLKEFHNAITYVELARCYSIIGLKNKAAAAMKNALHMGCDNRFVLRSATRLFLHNGDIEFAHYILRRNPLTQVDPWLIAAEISVSMMQGRYSRFTKKGIEIIDSRNVSPFNFTELASALGTLEMNEGSRKKSRQFFAKALLKPNDNSLAQIEWASHKDGQSEFNPDSLAGVDLNYEAMAFKNYHAGQFKPALANTIRWFNDMPYSKRPIMFASSLASNILKDQPTAIMLVNAGLISHPNDPGLINNLSYALALNDQPNEALKSLTRIKNEFDIDDPIKICLQATKGLIMFRNGNPEIGRRLYYDAFEKTRGLPDHSLNWSAILNYAREEIRIGYEHIDSIMETVARIPEKSDDMHIEFLRNDVIKYYEEFKLKDKTDVSK